MAIKHQMYGLFSDAYYEVSKPIDQIVIPENADYKTPAIQSEINDAFDICEVTLYSYKSDIVTDVNLDRVAYMKELLLNDKITKIDPINNEYVIEITYDLYNNCNKVLSSGKSAIRAKLCEAIINDDIAEDNSIKHRSSLVFDGRIEIQVPDVSKYGIKNAFVQHPYKLRINEINVYSTVGDNKYIVDSSDQINDLRPNHSSHASYRFHEHTDLHCNNFASHFVTNAKVGTTIIDSIVVPAEVEVPPQYTEVTVCTIPCDDMTYTIKANHKLNMFVVNIEVLLDNMNIVYDKADIDAIITLNNTPKADSTPDAP